MVSSTNTPSTAPVTPEAVLRFLEDNPDFLIRYHLNSKTNAGKVIDLGQAVIQGAGDVLRRFEATRGKIEDIHAANTEAMLRVHQSAYLLMAANSRADITALIRDHFPQMLGIAGACIVAATDSDMAELDGVVAVEPALLPELTHAEAISLGVPDANQVEIFASIETPKTVAFAALPEILPHAGSAGVLALASTDPDGFVETDATDLIEFTATMIAIGLIARAAS